jgi:ankyrin repeat protein
MSVTVVQKFQDRVRLATKKLSKSHAETEHPTISSWLRIVKLVQLQQKQYLSRSEGTSAPQRANAQRPSHGQRQPSNEAAIEGEIPVVDFQKRQRRLMKNFCNIWLPFFEGELYQAWRDGRQWTLCCHGELGCGKSTLAAAVAHDLSTFHSKGDAAVVVLFLDEKDECSRKIYQMAPEIDPLSALRLHILQQLMEFREARKSASNSEIAIALKKLTMPSFVDRLLDFLSMEIQILSTQGMTKLYFVVDGLDRCPPEVESAYLSEFARLDGLILITRGQPMSETNVRSCDVDGCDSDAISLYFRCHQCESDPPFDLCVSCYQGGHVCPMHGSSFQEPYQDRSFALCALDDHIAMYVHKEIEREILSTTFGQDLLRSKDILESIEKTITERAHGVLVIARVWLDYLIKHQQVDELLNNLARVALPELSYFAMIIRHVENQAETDRKLALLSLQIITKALCEAQQEGITYMELIGALRLQNYDIEEPMHLLRVCQGAIVVSDLDQSLVPFHRDFEVYLHEEWLKSQHPLDMAEVCLRSICKYLIQLHESQQIYDDVKAFLEEDAFLTYALQNWGHHFAAYQTEAASDQIMSLMNDTSAIARYTSLLCLSKTDGGATLNAWPGCQPIHLCAFFGLVDILDRLRRENEALNIDARDATLGRTALMIACERGQAAIIQPLLKLGADTTVVCRRGRSAISIAIEHRYDGIFDLLLPAQRWSNLGREAENTETFRKALCIASERQDPYCLRKLLQSHGRKLDLQQSTLPIKCLLSGNLASLRCLTENSVFDWAFRNQDGETALHVAARINIESLRFVVDCLEQHGLLSASVQRLSSAGKTPAQLALQHLGRDALEALKILYCGTAQMTIADKDGRTMFHHAAAFDLYGHCLELLHDEGLPFDGVDNIGWSPLHLACCRRNRVAAFKLLEFGARTDIKDNKGWTAMDIVSLYDPNDATGIASKIAQYMPCQKSEKYPFWAQFRSGVDMDAQQLSLISREDIRAIEPNNQNNLLHWAAATNNEGKLRVLLEDGRIDVNSQNADLHTPLTLHCIGFNGPDLDIVKLLLRHGSDHNLSKIAGTDFLDLAMNSGSIDVAMLFIERCDVLASTSVSLQLLLQHAIQENNIIVVEKLLKAGASVLEHDESGCLPIQRAREIHGADLVIAILDQHLRLEIEEMCPLTQPLFASPDLRSESPPPDGKADQRDPHSNRQDSYADFWTNRSNRWTTNSGIPERQSS